MIQTRRLAAIMFTDIVGYTALMAHDEQKAFELLRKNRAIQKPIIEQYHGRWIKELGDGVMTSFNSVSDAATAAIKIQKACNTANEFKLRIGIHLGDVVFENDDVFGDGVNIAARIQAQAPVGGIWVSEPVHQNLVNKNEVITEFVKTIELKNVKEPVKIYRIVLEGEVPDKGRAATSESSFSAWAKTFSAYPKPIFVASAILFVFLTGYIIYSATFKKEKPVDDSGLPDKTIAVLPFTDMSPEKDQEYLGDGLAEEIITVLSGIKDLTVIGRTSSFQFKGEKIDLREIGEKLNAGTILEGSVRKSGNQIRITAQLINVRDNAHLWSHQYDREMNDIFKIQDEIAAHIAELLKISLSVIENRQTPEISPETYTLYLKGLYAYRERKYEESIDYNLQVIQADSTYALSYAYIALSKAWIINREHDFTNASALLDAREFALKSIDLSPRLAEGYSALALLSWSIERNFSKAREYFEQSILFSPNNALITNRFAYFLLWMGQFDYAAKLALRARQSDPVDNNSYIILANAYQFTGRFKDANQNIQEALRLFKDNNQFRHLLITNAFRAGQYAEVIAKCDSILKRDEQLEVSLMSQLSISYFRLNRNQDGNKILGQLEQLSEGKGDNANFNTAVVFAARNQPDSCIYWLSRSFERLEIGLRLLKIEPFFSYLKNEPGYKKIYKAYGFDNY